jgi:hypothetical protein
MNDKNKSVFTEGVAWAWHNIMSAGGSTPVPFPTFEDKSNEHNTQ